ncbi:MAG: hypothetical protein U5K29_12860 [Acidimicrobiales bacterium]|nr:hypothetical protein [Acidimicrobiales bacterium]
MSDDQFTQEEVETFARKLDEWGGSLPERERSLLYALLAKTEESEVEGFGSTSFPETMFSGGGGSLPKLDSLATDALRPMAQQKDPWVLRAYDEWYPG